MRTPRPTECRRAALSSRPPRSSDHFLDSDYQSLPSKLVPFLKLAVNVYFFQLPFVASGRSPGL